MEETLKNIEIDLLSIFPQIQGTDSEGEEYDKIRDLWDFMFFGGRQRKRKGRKEKSTDDWYEKAYNYWEDSSNCPISDGMIHLLHRFLVIFL
jgi:hypothetical protein